MHKVRGPGLTCKIDACPTRLALRESESHVHYLLSLSICSLTVIDSNNHQRPRAKSAALQNLIHSAYFKTTHKKLCPSRSSKP